MIITLKGEAQSIVSNNRIGFLTDMPFFIESSLYKNHTIEYFPDNTVLIRMEVLSSEIKIGYFSEKKVYSNINRLDFKKTRGVPLFLSKVEFRIEGTNLKSGQWKELRFRDSAYLNQYIVDTLLGEGQQLLVKFRKPAGKVFQTVELNRVIVTPSVLLYKEREFADTTNEIFRKFILNKKNTSSAFKEVIGNSIEVSATHNLELIFLNQLLNEDSSILYRLNPKSGNAPWIETGHFALLRGLNANRTYSLEVKYKGVDISNKYRITILPFWYQTNFAISIFAALALLTLLIIWLIWQKIKLKADRRKIEFIQYKLKAIQSQLNPHFIFNALSSIQSLVNNDEKSLANKYLNNFSNVLRGALKNGEVIFLPLTTELELMRNYIEIEQLRFQFEYNLIIDASLNLSEIEVPPMLFQPSIENAIKHGGGRKGEAGIINIQISKKGNGFYVSIFDNGQWKKMTESSGIGISLTKERIDAINNMTKERKMEFRIDTSTRGTITYFYFYNWLI